MNEREELMKKLQTIQFALVDLGLYLDTHPSCAEALQMYKDLTRQAQALKNEYEQSYGALIAGQSGNTDYWDWVATPFPWEI